MASSQNSDAYIQAIDEQIKQLKNEIAGSGDGPINPYYEIGEKASGDVKKNKKQQATKVATAAVSGIASAGIGAILVGVQDTLEKYQAYRKQARGGPMTDSEVSAVVSAPYMDKLPFWKQFTKISPVHIIGKQVLGTTKGGDQVKRDRVRKDLRKTGFLSQENSDDYTINFTDGASFDLGKDGGATLINSDGKSQRKYREIDFSNPLAQKGLNYVNGLGYVVASGVPDQNTGADFSSYFTNAVTEGAKDEATIKARAKELYEKTGINSLEAADAMYDEMVKNKRISEEAAAAFKQAARDVGLTSSEVKEEPAPQQGGGVDYDIPQEKPMSKQRLNSRFSTGFSARPIANDTSTGVNQYLAMLEQMARR